MSDRSLFTYYDLLGVSSDATPEQIQDAYRGLVAKLLPDVGRFDNLDTSKLATALNEAWSTLRDPAKRKEYDAIIAPRAKTEAVTRTLGSDYAATELTDERAREYVDHLEKARAYWNTERVKALKEQQARAAEAQPWQETQAAVERVRQATAAAKRIVPLDHQTPDARWTVISLAAIVIMAAAVAGWMLLAKYGTPASRAPVAAPAHKAGTRPVAHATARAAPTSATAHVATSVPAPVAPAQTSAPAAAAMNTPAPAAVVAAYPSPVRVAHAAPTPHRRARPAGTCEPATITSVAPDGSQIATSDGFGYRIDMPSQQQQAAAWKAGDTVSICTNPGAAYSTLDHGRLGMLQGARSTLSATYGNPPVCSNSTVASVADDGSSLQTSDGHAYRVDDDVQSRTVVRSWGPGFKVTVCATTERNGAVRVAITGSDNLKITGAPQKGR